MESFDQSLKYLLQHEPADFIRFGLGGLSVEVLGPLPSGLPSRGRDVDGSYLIACGEDKRIAHIEFHRRHQSLEELAIDVAEAQIRLFRRQRMPVISFVWDLYGKLDEPVLTPRCLSFGAPKEPSCSQCVYHQVNLRGLGWEELLTSAPGALWPLVALTRDGASDTAVLQARDAVEARTELSEAEQADQLAVLYFVAGAEGLSAQMIRGWISEGRVMESELYRLLFKESEEKADAKRMAETIIRILMRRTGGEVDLPTREKIRALSDIGKLTFWYEEALDVVDAEGARRLVETIQKAAPAQNSP